METMNETSCCSACELEPRNLMKLSVCRDGLHVEGRDIMRSQPAWAGSRGHGSGQPGQANRVPVREGGGTTNRNIAATAASWR